MFKRDELTKLTKEIKVKKLNRQYYIGPQNPNGTHDLIITDQDAEVIGHIPCAVFGLNGPNMSDMLVVYHGESVGVLPDGLDDMELENILTGEAHDLYPVREISREQVLNNLALCPFLTHINALRRLSRVSREQGLN